MENLEKTVSSHSSGLTGTSQEVSPSLHLGSSLLTENRSEAVLVILAISVLIGAITQLLKVLVPVMMKNKD